MIKAVYSEMDGPAGVTRRLSVQGHAGYAPAGQDIVCAGASILMQALVWMVADIEGAECMAADGPDGPRVAVTAGPDAGTPDYREKERLAGGFELAKAGLALLAERYPDHLRYTDTSRRGAAGQGSRLTNRSCCQRLLCIRKPLSPRSANSAAGWVNASSENN